MANETGFTSLETLAQGEVEHKAWQDLCEQLVATGAVTQADANSPARMRDTPGQRLFSAIRAWGDERGKLAVHLNRDKG